MQPYLFLGTAKNVVKLWIKSSFLSKKDLQVLEDKINSLDIGTGIGQLPHRIESNYWANTASQWKNWTLMYSMFCLKHLLPDICSCLPVLSKRDLLKADPPFVKFGERFEQLYAKKDVTPNMHLHCHLNECDIYCGPVHVFWCFSFEQLYGILAAM